MLQTSDLGYQVAYRVVDFGLQQGWFPADLAVTTAGMVVLTFLGMVSWSRTTTRSFAGDERTRTAGPIDLWGYDDV